MNPARGAWTRPARSAWTESVLNTQYPTTRHFLCFKTPRFWAPMGLPQPQNYQLCLWLCPWGFPQPQSYQLCLWLCLWGCPSLRVTSYACGYAYGVAPASELPAMPMAMTMGLPSSLRVTSYAYGYAYGVAPASELPAMPMAMPSKSNGLFNYYGIYRPSKGL